MRVMSEHRQVDGVLRVLNVLLTTPTTGSACSWPPADCIAVATSCDERCGRARPATLSMRARERERDHMIDMECECVCVPVFVSVCVCVCVCTCVQYSRTRCVVLCFFVGLSVRKQL